MAKQLFTVYLIAKNEVDVLPRCINSLTEFMANDGEVILLDTGSTDKTVEVAKALGVKVYEVGEKFITTITGDLAKRINKQFVVGDEKEVVKAGDKLFDFAASRNYIANLASTDMVLHIDADEVFTRLDFNAINKFIEEGYRAFENHFVFAHDEYNNPVVQFVQARLYDRTVINYSGIVHEVLTTTVAVKRTLLSKDVLMIDHYQVAGKEHRRGYLTGLALDCYQNPTKDRQSHYFAREMMYAKRHRSAIKEFERHITLNGWNLEAAQSMIYIGNTYGYLNEPHKQAEWYYKSFHFNSERRDALIKLAEFYKWNGNHKASIAYAKAALEIPYTDYYANTANYYKEYPHELLYFAYGWTGRIKEAQEHILKALEFSPYNPIYLRDTQFYFEYPNPPIEGWMKFDELQFLYNNAKKFNSVIEVGSWKGRSTHALCSGCKGEVVAIDHFEGSKAEPDAHAQAKDDKVYNEFLNNMKDFKHLQVDRNASLIASENYDDNCADMVFIDAGHTYEEVKEDIKIWKNKARFLLCGHDYSEQLWPDVKRAVDEELNIDGVAGTIWYKFMNMPKVSIVIPSLGRPDKLQNCLDAIKENANYENYEVIVEYDSFENRQGAPKTFKKGVEKSKGELVMFLGNDCVPKENFLINAVRAMYITFGKEMDGLVALNDGYWNGEMATHWLASKKLLPYLGGEFFHTGYYHTGCDNELTGRCKKLGKYVYAEDAKLYHDHPLNNGWTGTDIIIAMAYSPEFLVHDRDLLYKRANDLGFEVEDCSYRPLVKGQIPKRIFTIWLSNDPMPELVEQCIEKQKIEGYEHRLITLDNCWKGSPYVQSCIDNKAWTKAADFLRMYYLYTEGGIYLDADTEVLEGKNFDEFLDYKMFVCKEDNGFIANGIVGSIQDHPLLGDFLNYIENNFKGDDNKIFEAGMEVFTNMVYGAKPKWGIEIFPPEVFLPFNHQTEITNITDRTITYHHYTKFWLKAGQEYQQMAVQFYKEAIQDIVATLVKK